MVNVMVREGAARHEASAASITHMCLVLGTRLGGCNGYIFGWKMVKISIFLKVVNMVVGVLLSDQTCIVMVFGCV